jgi:osmotically-inducible protein OsmY
MRRGRNRAVILWLLICSGLGACGARRGDPVEVPDPVVDRRIQAELRSRLASEPILDPARIRVEVEAARVRLYGSVEGIGAWNCALRNAWLIQGVEAVTDFLVIERGPAEVTCLAVRS